MRVHLADGSELVSALDPGRLFDSGRRLRDPRHFPGRSPDPELIRQGRTLVGQLESVALLSRWDDRTLVAKLRGMMLRGQILWLEPLPSLQPIPLPASAVSSSTPSSAPPPASQTGSSPSASSQTAPDAATFPASVDQACLADALTAAAATGVPFCEECQAAQAA